MYMAPLLCSILLLMCCPAGVGSMWTVMSSLSVKAGGAISIPCSYDRKHRGHVKYWCRGASWSYCLNMVRTDSPQRRGDVSIIDDPIQQVFTVTLRNLQEGDTATYWCGVEIKGTTVDGASIYLRVTKDTDRIKTMSKLTVQRGASITIPCHYDWVHRHRVKYWCRQNLGGHCDIIVCTNSTQGGRQASITDDNAHLLFTVTLSDLQRADSGVYRCGVEIDRAADDTASLYLDVTGGFVGLSVLNNMVAGEEGGSVIVRCRYGNRLGQGEKWWCRSGDWSSCLTAGGTGTSQHASVLITDDQRGEMSVTVTELQREDAGWYLCIAADLQIPVHLTVTPRPMQPSCCTPSLPTAHGEKGLHQSHDCHSCGPHLGILSKSAVGAVYLACTVIAALTIWRYHKHKRGRKPTEMDDAVRE
ncbi:hypothetical protein AAFF_G00299350 [Aldrovandia affinis]|uniref:Ig-like domain-containing protein n=1 Tax=Aldrovandia affinis TaxID=143900 RepID=A0AAD7W183_9TELE|nr:hypothetical protein AAFF_G00299350 [Aldrovandia affinis]